ncbi:hypothetical protein AB0I28_30365 [Phytomonospora sp. NPDC050363]|uniref:hypothetical protein n=1 Tax=Phytomonospora sp. NPDC050363 TaxID=3155642 RepID=UPI0033D3E306
MVSLLAERERLARASAGMVVAEIDGDRVEITGRGGDLQDVEVLAYSAIPGAPDGTGRRRPLLAQDESWSVPGPAAGARWIVWWTCPAGYRWRLTVEDHHRGLHCVARPPGSAPRDTGAYSRWRNTAWPYAYPSPRRHENLARPARREPRPADEPVEVTLVELCGIDMFDEEETVLQFAPGRTAPPGLG